MNKQFFCWKNVAMIIACFAVLFFVGCDKIFNDKEEEQTEEEVDTKEKVELQEQGGGTEICQCVAYIKHQLQITTSTANALDWGTVYKPNGFQLVSGNPQKGDLIVITPAVGSYWANTAAFKEYGHIAIIHEVEILDNSNLKMILRGANQGNNGVWDDCGCPNVKDVSFTLPANLRDKIRVYRKHNPYLCYKYAFPPTLNSPQNNSTNVPTPINFIWEEIANNPEYRIQISKKSSSWSEDIGFNESDREEDTNTGANNFYQWNNAQTNTTYYWSVKSFVNGVSSEYSEPYKFTTQSEGTTDDNIAILLSPLSYDFGSVFTSICSLPISFTISSTGNGTLIVNSISSNNSIFKVSGLDTPVNIGSGQFQTFEVTFEPTAVQIYSGTITVSSNAGTKTILLSGVGIDRQTQNTQPTVTINSYSNLTGNAVTISATVASDGGSSIIERGICWSSNTTTPTKNDFNQTISGTTGSFNCNLTGLSANTTYYARAFATNSQGTSYSTDYISFKTGGNANQPPQIPSNPNPSNNANNISTSTTLSWNSSDPEGDPLGYDLYIGTSSNNLQFHSSGSGTSQHISGLSAGTAYYWKVIAYDNKGASTAGPVWQFATQAGSSNTPKFTPQQGEFTGCASGYWDCNGHRFYYGTIKATVISYNQTSITFRIKKCDDGRFTNSGTAYVNVNRTCTAMEGHQYYSVNSSYIDVSAPLRKGNTTYYITVASATNDYFSTTQIIVTN
ncbi:MAG: fibronectin type III domain-containing protein [Tannerellaceae bacterium]|jgi:hypothetical protein|nr:fibronectin type III domain-containing protein [Tannerellaceae bacterium]